jgi:hypothetical protein
MHTAHEQSMEMFMEPGRVITMKQPLRRTLVLFFIIQHCNKGAD